MRMLGLVLVDGANEFQQLLADEAEAAAKRAGFAFGMRTSGMGGYELGAQLKLIDAWLDGDGRPDALLVLAARERGLARTIREAARRGIHWIGLNRTEDDLDAVRREFPGIVVATVCPDEKETGRIQARIVRRLLPGGGRVLNVTGHSRSLTARDRSAGFAEALAGGPHEVVSVEAGWSAAEAHAVVGAWLRIALRVNRRLDAIVCHTDSLAEGTRQALDEVRSELGRQDLEVPVVGCDGSPGLGQALVASGRLAGTVVLPRVAATAIGLLSAAVERGTPVPSFTALAGHPWPEDLASPRGVEGSPSGTSKRPVEA
jgi:ribose transport system substrate-binding protein